MHLAVTVACSGMLALCSHGDSSDGIPDVHVRRCEFQ